MEQSGRGAVVSCEKREPCHEEMEVNNFTSFF